MMKNTFTKQLPHLIPLCAVGLTLLIGSWNTATAQDTQQTKNVYLNLSLEELNQLDVTSVTGVEEQWFKAPAAIYVITPEDIQRTGHRTLADLLRIVPGLNVASSSSNTWSVGARGIRGHYSDSLLVQIDGRSIDDPLAAFGHWDTVDMILQDISNIEVIRGPGTTLWGADAVSGVINVTTKPAKETQGWLINTVTGTYEQAGLSMRYGGQIDDNAFFKVWGKGSFRDAYERVDGSDAHDDWSIFSGGFRIGAPLPFLLSRFLNHHQFVEPLKTKFLYTSRMRGPKKRGSREKFLYVFCGSQGAQTPDYPRHTNPGLRPHTPPVKHIPGGQPHLPQIID